ncbi:GNAT family N-acetyltransferase [Falsibacillus albus]|uniref:N-acetyltransferase n=1 Tax=Falsibacillus albus TaxID=2478915 RepID=A0A3L7K5G3_9BACI|nr:GNAT family protein [Falsibacillus albus]RLQ97504.1 N-acetyltransferase [Falsibacillus albus]
MKNERIVLEGQYVELLPMEYEYLENLVQAGLDEQIWTYMPTKAANKDKMKMLVTQAMSNRETGVEYPFVIKSKEHDRIIGSTRFLDISLPNKNLEIGWTWLNPSVWRSAVNTECKLLLMEYCFETLGLNRVMLKTDSRNNRSRTAILRLGAKEEGTMRMHRVLEDGYIRDTVMFSVIKPEWPGVKERLIHYLKKA